MSKKWKTAPLPFQGQKRCFVKEYTTALEKFPKNAIYVDLFGGSGLLSRIAKDVHPEAKVVYNDYDGFEQRLNAIPQTNELIKKLQKLTSKIESKKKIDTSTKASILKAIAGHFKKHRYVDYITISASVLFSGKYATSFNELASHTMYNRVRKSPLPLATDYLNGLEVVSKDFKQLYNEFKDVPNVVFLLDPPYLSTDTTSYNSDKYWKLRDYLDVLEVLEGSKYFYFTSNKSSIVELMEWFETTTLKENPFKESEMITRTNGVNYNVRYTDIMLFKNE